jgi:hypothetical protein
MQRRRREVGDEVFVKAAALGGASWVGGAPAVNCAAIGRTASGQRPRAGSVDA